MKTEKNEFRCVTIHLFIYTFIHSSIHPSVHIFISFGNGGGGGGGGGWTFGGIASLVLIGEESVDQEGSTSF